MNSNTHGTWLFVLGILGITTAHAGSLPVAVSPGDQAVETRIDTRCPTFSWGAVQGAESYELAVYEVAKNTPSRRVLLQTHPGSVTSWTPPLDRCLLRGHSYAWWIRTIGESDQGDWSAPVYFEVSGQFSTVELEESLEIVNQYLSIQELWANGNQADSTDVFAANEESPSNFSEYREWQDDGLDAAIVAQPMEDGYGGPIGGQTATATAQGPLMEAKAEDEPLDCGAGTVAWQEDGEWQCVFTSELASTRALEPGSHGFHIAEGLSVLFGDSTTGEGNKLMFLPDLPAFRAGSLESAAAAEYWDPVNVGEHSFASGLNTRAQGFGATAMGRDTEASNSYAFASGFFTNAHGQYSTAMGFNTDALGLGATALGYSTDAEQNYSFAAGYYAAAQGLYSVALGNATWAQSYASVAVGRYNVGGGSASSWNSTDPIFEIGIGTGPSSRQNAVTVRKNGNVGIGTTAPLDALHVNGRVRVGTVEYMADGGTNELEFRGDLRPSSDNVYDLGTTSYRWDDVYATSGTVNTSDRRAKQNIEDLTYGLDQVLQLHPVTFTWKEKPHKGRKIGLIAQEVEPLIPELVQHPESKPAEDGDPQGAVPPGKGGYLGLYYSDLVPVLVQAIKQQQAQFEQERLEMRALLAAQAQRIERMEARLDGR